MKLKTLFKGLFAVVLLLVIEQCSFLYSPSIYEKLILREGTNFVALSITSPADNSTLYQTNITLSGTASADTGHYVTSVIVRTNGGKWGVATGTTNWTKILNLVLNTNTIDIRAIGDNRLTNITTWTLVYKKTLMNLSIDSHADGAILHQANITLSGTVSADSGHSVSNVQVQLNGGSWSNATGTANWQKDLTLVQYTNTIGVRAIADNGMTNTINWTLAYYPPLTQIATGYHHSLALAINGTLYATGKNDKGQLGTGNTNNRIVWTPVLSNVQAIAARSSHSLAVTSNGILYATGKNASGQLGTGNTTNIDSWTEVLTGVKAIAAGGSHSLALTTSGILYATGDDTYGQLGTGNTANTNSWRPVLSNVQAIAGGYAHSLALTTDHTLYVTGYNFFGQLGTGDTATRSNWTEITNISGVQAIAAGSYQSLALTTNGTLYVTGYNSVGQLGTGNTTNTNSWIQVLSNVQAIAAGDQHSLAIKNGNTLYATGRNVNGQLGTGNNTDKHSWTEITNISGITAIAAGYSHSLAIKNDGSLYATGQNAYGQFGKETTSGTNSWTEVWP